MTNQRTIPNDVHPKDLTVIKELRRALDDVLDLVPRRHYGSTTTDNAYAALANSDIYELSIKKE